MSEKLCSRCHERERRPSGSYCELCEREYNRARYQDQREKYAERAKLRYLVKRDEIKARQKAYREAHPEREKAWVEANREKVRATSQRWREQNRDKQRSKHLVERYRMTVEDFDGFWQQQKGKCAICRIPLAGINFHIDHDHATDKARGLLCRGCNHGLGQFSDNPRRLRAAARYLERHQIKT